MHTLKIPHLENEPLAKYTSYRIGGPARIFALPRSRDDIKSIGEYLRAERLPYFVLGNGSNVLVPDEGFAGVVICLRDFEQELEFLPGDKVRASCSTLNSRLLRAAADKGLGGIEFLSGVPGNVGGAVFMNAGTAEGWIANVVTKVEVTGLDGADRVIPQQDLKYSYREQHFLNTNEVIVSAELQLSAGSAEDIKARLAEATKKRKNAQPIELPSCGSVFRNPPGLSAWSVVEKAGLRGKKIGGARISDKHCNFIVNEGGAVCGDVLALITLAKEKALETSGVRLQEEVVLLRGKEFS